MRVPTITHAGTHVSIRVNTYVSTQAGTYVNICANTYVNIHVSTPCKYPVLLFAAVAWLAYLLCRPLPHPGLD